MPNQLPAFGETWTNTAANVDGIVALVTNTVVTFVSLTGMWAPTEFNRKTVPWVFKHQIPSYHQTCCYIKANLPESTVGPSQRCHWPAFIAYQRNPIVSNREVVCPRHIPRGVRSQVIQSLTPGQPFQGQLCSKCLGSGPMVDAIEVMGEVHHSSGVRMWTCPFCGDWWVHLVLTSENLEKSSKAKITEALSDRYRIGESTEIYNPVTLTCELKIFLKPLPNTKLKGHAPLTLYYHLRGDDEF